VVDLWEMKQLYVKRTSGASARFVTSWFGVDVGLRCVAQCNIADYRVSAKLDLTRVQDMRIAIMERGVHNSSTKQNALRNSHRQSCVCAHGMLRILILRFCRQRFGRIREGQHSVFAPMQTPPCKGRLHCAVADGHVIHCDLSRCGRGSGR
jgi:hypothetical protein